MPRDIIDSNRVQKDFRGSPIILTLHATQLYKHCVVRGQYQRSHVFSPRNPQLTFHHLPHDGARVVNWKQYLLRKWNVRALVVSMRIPVLLIPFVGCILYDNDVLTCEPLTIGEIIAESSRCHKTAQWGGEFRWWTRGSVTNVFRRGGGARRVAGVNEHDGLRRVWRDFR